MTKTTAEGEEMQLGKETYNAAVRKFMQMDRPTAPLLRELMNRIDAYEVTGTGKNRTYLPIISFTLMIENRIGWCHSFVGVFCGDLLRRVASFNGFIICFPRAATYSFLGSVFFLGDALHDKLRPLTSLTVPFDLV